MSEVVNELTEQEAKDYRAEIAGETWDDQPANSSTQVDETLDDTAIQAVKEEIEPKKDLQAETPDPAPQDILTGINSRLDTMDTLDYRLKQAESRIGAVQNSIHNEMKAAKEAANVTANAPDKDEIIAAAKNDEEWEGLKDDYPEWSDVMDGLEKRFAAKDAVPDINVDSIRTELKTDFDKKLTDARGAFEVRLVDVSRPGWREIVQSAEYKTWLQGQTQEIQEQSFSDRAEDAIAVLNAFDSIKPETQETPEQIQEKRQARLTRSQTVTGQGKPTKTKTEADMTDLEYRAKLAREYEDI